MKQKGSAMVESALIILLFLTMMFGAIDFAHIMFLQQALYERTRGAVRTGVAKQYTADQIKNLILYNDPTAPTTPSNGYMDLTSSDVSVSFADSGYSSQRVTVTVQRLTVPTVSFLLPASIVTPNIVMTLNTEVQ